MSATVTVLLSNISDPDPTSHKRTATFGAGNGNPSWATVGSDGQINVSNAPPGDPDVDFVFELPTGSPVSFATTNPFTVTGGTSFSVTENDGSSITVDDSNSNQWEYTLNFSDSTGIDPLIINR